MTLPHPEAPPEGPFAFFDDVPRPGETLMARDTTRLESGSAPSLVWFTWDRPTITLGRLQNPAQALDLERCATDGVPVVTRPTGGRAVFHVDEWTYGAVVPLDHPVLGGKLSVSCRAIVALIEAALVEAYGLRVGGPAAGDGPDGACFSRSFGYETVADGRKLMGSAQRRSGRRLLQQGSLLVGAGHERLGDYLAAGDPRGSLARGAVTLSELLGRRPDPAPFRAALVAQWANACEAFVKDGRSS
jgi:lipoate-protein ligase A